MIAPRYELFPADQDYQGNWVPVKVSLNRAAHDGNNTKPTMEMYIDYFNNWSQNGGKDPNKAPTDLQGKVISQGNKLITIFTTRTSDRGEDFDLLLLHFKCGKNGVRKSIPRKEKWRQIWLDNEQTGPVWDLHFLKSLFKDNQNPGATFKSWYRRDGEVQSFKINDDRSFEVATEDSPPVIKTVKTDSLQRDHDVRYIYDREINCF